MDSNQRPGIRQGSKGKGDPSPCKVGDAQYPLLRGSPGIGAERCVPEDAIRAGNRAQGAGGAWHRVREEEVVVGERFVIPVWIHSPTLSHIRGRTNDLGIRIERPPPLPGHLDGRESRQDQAGLRSTPGLAHHLWPEGFVGAPVVHEKVVLPEKPGDSELVTAYNGSIEHQAGARQWAVGYCQLDFTPIQVHDLVPPEGVVGDRQWLSVDQDPHNPVLGLQIGVLILGIRGDKLRIGESRDPVPGYPSGPEERQVEVTGFPRPSGLDGCTHGSGVLAANQYEKRSHASANRLQQFRPGSSTFDPPSRTILHHSDLPRRGSCHREFHKRIPSGAGGFLCQPAVRGDPVPVPYLPGSKSGANTHFSESSGH
jgi:hypothetical protein